MGLTFQYLDSADTHQPICLIYLSVLEVTIYEHLRIFLM